MMGLQKYFIRLIPLAGLVFMLSLLVWAQNHWLVTSRHSIQWPHEEALVVVQLSDLHSTWFGAGQGALVRMVRQQNPDLIVITGDLVDGNRKDSEPALVLVEELVKLAPVFVSFGNHEGWAFDKEGLRQFEAALALRGAKVLRNAGVKYALRSGAQIVLAGLDDPEISPWQARTRGEGFPWGRELEGLYTLLLSHRPEGFDTYVDLGVDLVFTGHAHGGQVRLPWLGGLVAPDQGWLPTYDSGSFTREKTTMFVHRGLGNSIIPLRVFNYPQVLVVTLSPTSK